MVEPAYSFSLPSINDDTPLDCRIYHPNNLRSILSDTYPRVKIEGAVIAHPYAPLGGSFDDPIVLSVTEALLNEGFVVGTFNFRYEYYQLQTLRLVLTVPLEAQRARPGGRRGLEKPSKTITFLWLDC